MDFDKFFIDSIDKLVFLEITILIDLLKCSQDSPYMFISSEKFSIL